MPTAFYHLLANNLLANTTNFFVWATAIYWAYLSTKSVLATSILSGIYLVTTAACGIWFGSVVDHTRKKTAMLLSSLGTLAFFVLAVVAFSFSDPASFKTVASVPLWLIVTLLLFGAIAGNIRMIALPTAVTFLVPEDRRDRANGMSGMVFGFSFAISNVAAGVGLGFLGFFWTMAVAITLTVIAALHLTLLKIPEDQVVPASAANPPAAQEGPESAPAPTPSVTPAKAGVDLKGTYVVVAAIPGLFALIFFTTFNNFLGGIFMALMDAYGLSLVSVQFWGTLWGVLSLGFILGGLYISKFGLGKNPLRTLFLVNLLCWSMCAVMTLQPSIWLLAVPIFVWLCVAPFAEACEQTVLQRVVPQDRLGRVIGFAQSIEQSASPLTAFLIGPLAQFFFIPFMTTGRGVDWIGGWYGTGQGRGIGLVFVVAGILGFIVTLIAMRSTAFKHLTERYQKAPEPTPAAHQ
ncbi:MAG: nitrate/nitrite transporter [Fibrobacteria bacterium]|jgi:DHA3 family multidrug efflux protein-like MFS transporter|nr:nitrate/nitrite transporter [Fibrobacteria bacterium]